MYMYMISNANAYCRSQCVIKSSVDLRILRPSVDRSICAACVKQIRESSVHIQRILSATVLKTAVSSHAIRGWRAAAAVICACQSASGRKVRSVFMHTTLPVHLIYMPSPMSQAVQREVRPLRCCP